MCFCLHDLFAHLVFFFLIFSIFRLHGLSVVNNLRSTQSSVLRNLKKNCFILFLSVGSDSRPVVLINPNIKIQTESLSAKKLQDHRKKSLIDSGLDLLFKKHPKSVKDGLSPSTPMHGKQLAANDFKFQADVVLDNKEQQGHPDKRWKPFDSIKIYTDKMKGHEDHHKGIKGLNLCLNVLARKLCRRWLLIRHAHCVVNSLKINREVVASPLQIS